MKQRAVSISLALAAGILAGGILSACGVPEDSAPRPLSLEDPSSTQNFLPALPSISAEDEETVTIYFDKDQEDLKIAEILRGASKPVVPEDILNILLAGPFEQEIEEGYVSHLPGTDELLNTRSEDGVFVVNFKKGSRLEELSGLQMYLAAGQLVLSLVDNSDIQSVRVEIEGSSVALPSDNGDLARPVRREDYQALVDQSFPLDILVLPPFPSPDDEDEIQADFNQTG